VVDWPDPYKAGDRKPRAGRADEPRPRLQLVRDGEPTTHHQRWRPKP
jgi:anthraniloyl-CoA monooxygenase